MFNKAEKHEMKKQRTFEVLMPASHRVRTQVKTKRNIQANKEGYHRDVSKLGELNDIEIIEAKAIVDYAGSSTLFVF